ncbi:MAG TPA: hypothetical protein VG675_18965 [Bryobacteraceae bacterium]|nr:hypothetical protein [Bryobacteraceae bacterium]
MKMRSCLFALVFAAAPVAFCQQGVLGGPVSGYVYDAQAHVLRPVQGIPGASLLGDPIDLGMEVNAAYVSPRQDSAFAMSADGGAHFFRLDSGKATEVSLDGLAGARGDVAFSPSGTAAAIYEAGRVRVVTGLPDAPKMGDEIDIGQSGRVHALAVSDDGKLVLASVGGGVHLLSPYGENVSLVSVSDHALVAFAPAGHDGAVADATRAGLVLFRDLAGGAAPNVLATPDALSAPTGLAFSADGARLFLADSSGSIASFDLAAGSRADIACNCVPTGLSPMGRLFRVNEPGASPLWLLDASGSTARMIFVPAAHSDSSLPHVERRVSVLPKR